MKKIIIKLIKLSSVAISIIVAALLISYVIYSSQVLEATL